MIESKVINISQRIISFTSGLLIPILYVSVATIIIHSPFLSAIVANVAGVKPFSQSEIAKLYGLIYFDNFFGYPRCFIQA